MGSPVFPSPRLPGGVTAVRFTARGRTALRRDRAVIVFVRMTFPPGLSNAVLVAKALVIAPILLVFRVLFVSGRGTAITA